MKKASFIPVLLLLFMYSAQADKKGPLAAGDPAPLFMLQSTTSEWVSLRDFCGSLRNPWKNRKRLVVVSFWATYCAPCKKEIPMLDTLVSRHKDEVKLLLISVDAEGAQRVAPFVKEAGYKAQVLLDPYAKAAANYGIKGVPALLLIDRDGLIRYSSYGYREDAVSELGTMIDSLVVSAQPIAPVQRENEKPDTSASAPRSKEPQGAN